MYLNRTMAFKFYKGDKLEPTHEMYLNPVPFNLKHSLVFLEPTHEMYLN